MLDNVPEEAYRTKGILVVSAYDESGLEHTLALPISIHRPLEIVYTGKADIAQIYAATPMSGCLTGSTAGTDYTYSESTTETRSRSIGMNWDQTWMESHSVTNERSRTETNGVTITKYDLFTGVSGSYGEFGTQWHVGLESIIRAGYQGHYNQGWSTMRAHMTGQTIGEDHSVSDTVSQSLTRTEGHTIAQGMSDFYEISSSDMKLNSFTTTIFAGMYAVAYRQTTRLHRPGTMIAYNLCGEPSVAGQVALTDWVWSVDVAQGGACPPFPVPNLPPPQCAIGPCE
jgi:hypothetical protein